MLTCQLPKEGLPLFRAFWSLFAACIVMDSTWTDYSEI